MMWVDREVMLQEVHIRCPAISHWVEFCHSNPARLYYGQHTLYSHQGVQLFFHAWYLDNGTIIGDSLVAGKVLELILEDGPPIGLRVNVDKTEIFGQRKTREVDKDTSQSKQNLQSSSMTFIHKTLIIPSVLDSCFNSFTVCEVKRGKIVQGVQLFFHAWYLDNGTIIGDSLVAGKVLELILEDGPPIGLRVNVDKTEIFGQRKTREVADVLNYAFIASRFQSASLQTKLLRHSDIVTSGPAFENALSAFNAKIKIDLLSNPSE
ncbi:hypothetical protein Tco_0912370, partial [Tanacetum coccineum]